MTLLLADTSAWHRASHPAVVRQWGEHLAADRIATTPPVRLEVLYSSRSGNDYDALTRELSALHQVACGEAAFDRALEVQRALARKAALHHRSVKIIDLLVAAAAELGGASVWHYDSDYDRIAEITGQPTSWIAPRGSL